MLTREAFQTADMARVISSRCKLVEGMHHILMIERVVTGRQLIAVRQELARFMGTSVEEPSVLAMDRPECCWRSRVVVNVP